MNEQLELFADLTPINDVVEYKYSMEYPQMLNTHDYSLSVSYDSNSIQFDIEGVDAPKYEKYEASYNNDNLYKREIAQMQQSLYIAYERIKQLAEELSELKQGNKDA